MKIKLSKEAQELRRQWCSKGGKAGSKADKSRAGKIGNAAMLRALERMVAK